MMTDAEAVETMARALLQLPNPRQRRRACEIVRQRFAAQLRARGIEGVMAEMRAYNFGEAVRAAVSRAERGEE
jgi:hypothetical protein